MALMGAKVRLREFRLDDFGAALQVVGDPRVTDWLSFDARSADQTRSMIEGIIAAPENNYRTEYYLAITRLASTDLVRLRASRPQWCESRKTRVRHRCRRMGTRLRYRCRPNPDHVRFRQAWPPPHKRSDRPREQDVNRSCNQPRIPARGPLARSRVHMWRLARQHTLRHPGIGLAETLPDEIIGTCSNFDRT